MLWVRLRQVAPLVPKEPAAMQALTVSLKQHVKKVVLVPKGLAKKSRCVLKRKNFQVDLDPMVKRKSILMRKCTEPAVQEELVQREPVQL